MDSYVTLWIYYSRSQVRNPAGLRCCNSLPHPTSLLFPSMDVVCCKCKCGEGTSAFILGGGGACRPPAGWSACLPPLHQAVGASIR